MQVILLEKIAATGSLGEIVNVKAGFARNYLIPQGKAQMATKENIAAFENIRAELEAKEADSKEKAERTLERMNDIVITVAANASEEGKLYGSVSPQDIADALAEKEFSVEKRNIILENSIRNVGEYQINVELWNEVVAKVNLVVVAAEQS